MSVFRGPGGGVIIGLILHIVCIAAGVIGFSLIENWPLLDSFYMTVISVTTVGYAEVNPLSPGGRIFATVIIFFGLGTVFFTTTMLGRVILEGEFRGTLKRRQMKNRIEKLNGHGILCGYGRMGRIVAEELRADGVDFCVVDVSKDLEEDLVERGYPYIIGDATDETTLREAGIERARTIMCLLSSDADNLYLTIAAREINPTINIVARALDDRAEMRLKRGGADKVVASHKIAGHRVLQAAVRPTVSEFIDLVSDRQQLSLILEEIQVGPGSHLVGRSLKDAEVGPTYHVIVVAIKKTSGDMRFNPEASIVLAGGDILIAIGEEAGLEQLAAECKQPTRS